MAPGKGVGVLVGVLLGWPVGVAVAVGVKTIGAGIGVCVRFNWATIWAK